MVKPNAGKAPRNHTLAWPPLQSLAVKKKTFFVVQILGGEKLLDIFEKCR